jgi:CRISPR associated protein Cas1
VELDARGPGDFRNIDRRITNGEKRTAPSLISIEPGIALQTRKGSLCIRERSGEEKLYPARVHRLKTIILAGHGASVTSEALRWCARENVALFVMERAGECLTLLAAAGECDARRSSLGYSPKTVRGRLEPS